MKKRLGLFVLTFALCTSAVFGATTKIIVNGNEVKTTVSPIVKNGTTLVPIKVISQELGAIVEYDKVNKVVDIYRGNIAIRLAIGSKTMEIYESTTDQTNKITLDQAPIISNGTTMVPIRAITDAFQCALTYEKGVIDIKARVVETVMMTESEIALTDELLDHYASCPTTLGTFEFKYTVYECDRDLDGYNFDIYVEFQDQDLFYLLYDESIDATKRETAKTQLKDTMQQMADYLIKQHPGTIFIAGYDASYYVDITDEESLVFIGCCTWSNESGEFQWLPEIDNIEFK